MGFNAELSSTELIVMKIKPWMIISLFCFRVTMNTKECVSVCGRKNQVFTGRSVLLQAKI